MKRHIKYLTLALVALMFAACSKPGDRQAEGVGDQHSAWKYDSAGNFWEKEQDGDTTINF